MVRGAAAESGAENGGASFSRFLSQEGEAMLRVRKTRRFVSLTAQLLSWEDSGAEDGTPFVHTNERRLLATILLTVSNCTVEEVGSGARSSAPTESRSMLRDEWVARAISAIEESASLCNSRMGL